MCCGAMRCTAARPNEVTTEGSQIVACWTGLLNRRREQRLVGSTPTPSARCPDGEKESYLASNEAFPGSSPGRGTQNGPVVQRPGRPLDVGKVGGSSPPGTTQRSEVRD